MISLETKTQTSTSSSPLSTAPSEEGETPSLSFSELLKGAGSTKDDKAVQNGVVVLALDTDIQELSTSKLSKGDILLSLLKGNNVAKEEISALELNPAITKDMTKVELKALIADAKQYLKTKIIESEGFKKSEIQALPKTLKGLREVAKKFGLDISKITLEEVKGNVKIEAKPHVQVQSVDTKAQPQVKAQSIDAKAQPQVQTQSVEPIVQTKRQIPLKSTPLFVAQASTKPTTQQMINVKLNTPNTVEIRTPKHKEDETLKMLLRGEKVTQKDVGFTADFSVATARVIAPSTRTDARHSLESLLRGDQNESSTASKVDGLNVNKADSFEAKIGEAKQMIKYLSSDVKTAIEDYKSPFTRVKVQLNPQRLGEIDLTIVQRGKNLHINLSSNNAAINTLVLNANDLKAQLTNSGINNATLNFNNNSQSSEQGSFGQQQQNSQHERQAKEEYNYFKNEENNEEILNSLEIVVPHYA